MGQKAEIFLVKLNLQKTMVGRFIVGAGKIIQVQNAEKQIIGDSRFTKPLYTWVPSIAVSAVQIYKGEEFKEWNNHILMTSLKDQSLRKLEFKKEEVGNEQVIFKDQIGRLRDIKIDQEGKIYLLSNGDDALWVMTKK